MSPRPLKRLIGQSLTRTQEASQRGATDGGTGCETWSWSSRSPAAVGQGAPLFTGLAHPLTLRPVKTTAFPSGILELSYAPAVPPEAGQPAESS